MSTSKDAQPKSVITVEEAATAKSQPLLPSLPLPPVTAAEAAPVSRLDARERLLSTARAEGWYNSESEGECELEEEEERKRDRLTVVSSMVAVDTVVTDSKVAVLGSLGLVTAHRKKGKQFVWNLGVFRGVNV